MWGICDVCMHARPHRRKEQLRLLETKFLKHVAEQRNILNEIFKQEFQSKGRKLDPKIPKSTLELLYIKHSADIR